MTLEQQVAPCGVLLVDKPQAMSSHRVISILRKKLGIKKVGHAGTLDPKASGLLICCVGKATKISQYLMGQDKVYQTEVVLGATSTTYDDEGQITPADVDVPEINQIDATLQSFVGTSLQKPPIYSAIKKVGKKLYQYARAGLDVEIQPREIHIAQIKRLSGLIDANALSIEVHCQKGTYIRSLAHDIGAHLGCGGYARNIRRLQSGCCHIEQSLTTEEIEQLDRDQVQDKMVSIIKALEGIFAIQNITGEQAVLVRQGKPLKRLALADVPQGLVLLCQDNQTPVALTKRSKNNSFELLRVI